MGQLQHRYSQKSLLALVLALLQHWVKLVPLLEHICSLIGVRAASTALFSASLLSAVPLDWRSHLSSSQDIEPRNWKSCRGFQKVIGTRMQQPSCTNLTPAAQRKCWMWKSHWTRTEHEAWT